MRHDLLPKLHEVWEQAMSRSPTTPKRSARFLRAAERIAGGKAHYISHEHRFGGVGISKADVDALTAFAGEMLCFDDDGTTPNERTRHERVVFLCFAAAAHAR